jgi:preprotein translocase subunit SecA
MIRRFHETETPRLKPLDFYWRRAIGMASVAAQPFRRMRLGQIVAEANRADQRYGLAQLDDQGLRDVAVQLRNSLAREGRPSLRSAGQAFALIREVAERQLGMRPYDVQLMGGYALLQGRMAEMNTGEGKTLTATLPTITAALAGWPVHVITVNDYLVARDAEKMRPLYQWFGLSVGIIRSGMEPDDRRAAYACHVTYCSNTEVAFDYLRDRLKRIGLGRGVARSLHRARAVGASQDLMPGLCFAIVDEADSILIDEARTPLILSQEAEGGLEQAAYEMALTLARGLRASEDFVIRGASGPVFLTPAGQAHLARLGQAEGGMWAHRDQREDIVTRALTALHLMRRGDQYVIRDGAIVIVDESTGRIMEDRFWSDGLHQLVELKEGLPLSPRKTTLATMSYQRLFRRYQWLAAMTGTGREVAAEVHEVYGLSTVAIPPRRKKQLRRGPTQLLPTLDDKWQAVADEVARLQSRGVPVLVGTRAVAESQALSDRLVARGMPHTVLNALDEARESEIVAQAGHVGAVTIATNMAGRGTDIALGAGVPELGGLHVILTERHSSARVDRQLAGRAARQGDPGQFQMILSLEDQVLRDAGLFALVPLCKLCLSIGAPGLALRLIGLAQRTVEARNAATRRSLFRSEGKLQDHLAFTGESE